MSLSNETISSTKVLQELSKTNPWMLKMIHNLRTFKQNICFLMFWISYMKQSFNKSYAEHSSWVSKLNPKPCYLKVQDASTLILSLSRSGTFHFVRSPSPNATESTYPNCYNSLRVSTTTSLHFLVTCGCELSC